MWCLSVHMRLIFFCKLSSNNGPVADIFWLIQARWRSEIKLCLSWNHVICSAPGALQAIILQPCATLMVAFPRRESPPPAHWPKAGLHPLRMMRWPLNQLELHDLPRRWALCPSSSETALYKMELWTLRWKLNLALPATHKSRLTSCIFCDKPVRVFVQIRFEANLCMFMQKSERADTRMN